MNNYLDMMRRAYMENNPAIVQRALEPIPYPLVV